MASKYCTTDHAHNCIAVLYSAVWDRHWGSRQQRHKGWEPPSGQHSQHIHQMSYASNCPTLWTLGLYSVWKSLKPKLSLNELVLSMSEDPTRDLTCPHLQILHSHYTLLPIPAKSLTSSWEITSIARWYTGMINMNYASHSGECGKYHLCQCGSGHSKCILVISLINSILVYYIYPCPFPSPFCFRFHQNNLLQYVEFWIPRSYWHTHKISKEGSLFFNEPPRNTVDYKPAP